MLGIDYRVQPVALLPGDRFVIVTDGVLERNAATADVFGLLAATGDLHPREVVQEITRAVLRAVGGTLRDDATVLCLDWYGGGERDRQADAGANHHQHLPTSTRFLTSYLCGSPSGSQVPGSWRPSSPTSRVMASAVRRRRRAAARPSHRPVHGPGSGASVMFGQGLPTAAPGSAEGGLIVSDIDAAHDELVDRRIEVSDIWNGPPFPVEARQPGPDPERTSYGSFFYFTDPDSNTWLVQEVTTRLPGRMNAAETGYVSAADLESALRRAEAAQPPLR